MRRWARANGYNVSDRGRISAEVQAAYHASTSPDPTFPTRSARNQLNSPFRHFCPTRPNRAWQ